MSHPDSPQWFSAVNSEYSTVFTSLMSYETQLCQKTNCWSLGSEPALLQQLADSLWPVVCLYFSRCLYSVEWMMHWFDFRGLEHSSSLGALKWFEGLSRKVLFPLPSESCLGVFWGGWKYCCRSFSRLGCRWCRTYPAWESCWRDWSGEYCSCWMKSSLSSWHHLSCLIGRFPAFSESSARFLWHLRWSHQALQKWLRCWDLGSPAGYTGAELSDSRSG